MDERILKQIARCVTLGAATVMRQDEIEAGRKCIQPGDVEWFSSDDWMPDQVVSIKDKNVRIVAVYAKSPGHGSFRRLIEAINKAGLNPEVVEPFPHMEEILRHWKWQKRIEGRGWDSQTIWSPPS